MSEDKILLSIVIPVFDRQRGLENFLYSLEKSIDLQKYAKCIELIIVDDASPTAIIVPQIPTNNLVFQRNRKNLGAPKSREIGFSLSKGSFVHFHDSDDTFSSMWLTNIVNILSHKKQLDVLITARHDISSKGTQYRVQKFVHNHQKDIKKIKKRLIYRNCLGPLGGVTFSRKILQLISFKSLSSCQDWQMYLAAFDHIKYLESHPNITYNFNIDGNDRISNNPLKKIRGFMQLSKITAKSSIFNKYIRLYYLFTCREYIVKKRGAYKKIYNKHKVKILFWYLTITIYWNLFT